MQESDSPVRRCRQCGAKNRIPRDRVDLKEGKCGKCGAPLGLDAPGAGAGQYTLRCTKCWARNRVPAAKVDSGPVCGKCRKPLPTEELFAPQPLLVTEANFEKTVLRSPLSVLLFAWAPWCSTCRAFMPQIDQYAGEEKARIRVGKLNVDQNPNLTSRYAIFSVPQMFVFDRGDLKESFPGSLQKHEIRTKMAPYL